MIGLVAMNLGLLGCEKKAPPDPHLQEGYRLLSTDPQAAYDELGKALDQSDPKVRLGRGLALEQSRKYHEAERILLEIHGKADDQATGFALARVKTVLGKAEEARPLIDQVVATDPSNLSALLLQVCLAHDEDRARKSLELLERWSELTRSKDARPVAMHAEYYLAKKSLLVQLKRRVDAAAAAEQAKQAKLAQRAGAFALVELAVRAGRLPLAVEVLRKINDEAVLPDEKRQVAKLAHGLGDHELTGQILETLTGNDPELLGLIAEHEFAVGTPAAVPALRKALSSSKDDAVRARLWLLLAEALLRGGQVEEARVEAEQLVKHYPSENGLLLLVRLDLTQENADAALQRLAPVLAQNQASLEVRELAVMAHMQLAQRDSARAILDSMLKESPGHLRAARLRIALEVEAGKPKEGVRVAEELVARAPDNVGLRMLLAEVSRTTGGNAAAVAVLQSGVSAVPGDDRLWMALVAALEGSKAEKEALSALESAHEKLPRSTMITAALATKLVKLGQSARAAALYEELLRDAQGDPVALNNLAMLYVDRLANVPRGLELAEQAYRLAPVPGIADTLGWALFKRGTPADVDRARQLLESVRLQLTSPTARYHLGAVLLAAGEALEGKTLLRQALSQGGEFAEAEQARLLLASGP